MNRLRWALIEWLVPDYCNSAKWPDASKIREIHEWRGALADRLGLRQYRQRQRVP